MSVVRLKYKGQMVMLGKLIGLLYEAVDGESTLRKSVRLSSLVCTLIQRYPHWASHFRLPICHIVAKLQTLLQKTAIHALAKILLEPAEPARTDGVSNWI